MVIRGSGPNLIHELEARDSQLVFLIQICSIILPIRAVLLANAIATSIRGLRAAAEELASKLTSGGWEVQREAPVGAMSVDLIARRGEEVVFYEFKLAGESAYDGWASQLLSYQKLARQHGAAFRLIMVRPRRQMDVEIDGVERMLFEFLVQHPPSEVSDIAGHTLIDEIVGVDLDSVRISGTTAEVSGEAQHRYGFQRLIAEVGLGHAGLVLSYDASRLARNNSDWHQLLQLCSMFSVLIADSERIYDPGLYHDRLLLGLSGIMSEAELHC
jgi:Holliday junction resolvase